MPVTALVRRFALVVLPFLLSFTAPSANAQTLDSAFDPGPDAEVSALVRQPDGKILVGGAFNLLGGVSRPYLARLTSAGGVDLAFEPRVNGSVQAIALQADGKILLGGTFTSVAGSPRARLARLNSDGTLDSSFSADVAGTAVRAIVVQADGKIVAGGTFNLVSNFPRAALARLNPDGSADTTWTANVTGNSTSSTQSDIFALALQSDGRLLVGGQFTAVNGVPLRGIARLFSDGRPDPSVNPFPTAGNVFALAVQPDGKILLGSGGSATVAPLTRGLARLNSDGTPDPDFTATTPAIVRAIALQSDGKIVAGGLFTTFNSAPRNLLVRTLADGQTDPSFPFEATSLAAGGTPSVVALVAAADGTIVIGGVFSSVAGQPRRSLARILPPALQITSSPAPTLVAATGTAVTLRATVTGVGVTYQWRKNAAPIPGATAASLTFSPLTSTDTGVYDLLATNPAGTVTTSATTLTAITAPTITAAPANLTTVAGARVVLSVTATGTAPFTYQWFRDGTPIAGAVFTALIFDAALPSDAAAYSVAVSNVAGTVTSPAATLTVAPLSRISNLSVLTSLNTDTDSFTLGYVVGGEGTGGPKPLVLRAAGPTLATLGVTGTLTDPQLQLYAGPALAAFNDNWSGAPALAAAFLAVGAFPFPSPDSKDAALLDYATARDNSLKISSVNAGTGLVIAEIYDATPSDAFSSATPRLLNVSVLKSLGTGLTVGFTIAGTTAKTVLIRAIGPTLATFDIPGAVSDPQLTLYQAGRTAPLATNDNWSVPVASAPNAAALTAAFSSVGAFALPANSRDAALLTTLPPGGYSVQVSGVAGTTGAALVEVYEVP